MSLPGSHYELAGVSTWFPPSSRFTARSQLRSSTSMELPPRPAPPRTLNL